MIRELQVVVGSSGNLAATIEVNPRGYSDTSIRSTDPRGPNADLSIMRGGESLTLAAKVLELAT